MINVISVPMIMDDDFLSPEDDIDENGLPLDEEEEDELDTEDALDEEDEEDAV